MNNQKIDIIICKTNDAAFNKLIDSLGKVNVPAEFFIDVIAFESNNKYKVYNAAMNSSNAKYKIYLDENIEILNVNFIAEIIKLFKNDETIGIIGTSGAKFLSTDGIALNSIHRCGKLYAGEDHILNNYEEIKEDYQLVEAIDGYFMATQYDLNWREELFSDNYFGDAAQCIEFRRKNYKTVVINQESPWIWYKLINLDLNVNYQKAFLDEYSKDIFPLVTIIIPTYNRPHYLKIALDSALNQTYRNIEIFISDNSSNEETKKLIQTYSDARIKYEYHPEFDANGNWNHCRHYNNPQAEYVNWLMDDDLFYPDKIAKMVDIYRNHSDVSLVTSRRNIIDYEGKILGTARTFFNSDIKTEGSKVGNYLFMDDDNAVGEPTTVLISKKFLRNNDICWRDDESGFISLVDISTWLQLLTKGKFFGLYEPLSAMRKHDEQLTNKLNTRLSFAIDWAKNIDYAWNNKYYLKTQKDIRAAIINWISNHAVTALKLSFIQNYTGKRLHLLEKILNAMCNALSNGYKIDIIGLINEDLSKKEKSD